MERQWRDRGCLSKNLPRTRGQKAGLWWSYEVGCPVTLPWVLPAVFVIRNLVGREHLASRTPRISQPLNRHPSTSCSNTSLQTLIATIKLCVQKRQDRHRAADKNVVLPSRSSAILGCKASHQGPKKRARGVEFYERGARAAPKILGPDVWALGQRLGADRLARGDSPSRATARVPKVLQPAFEGGTDGDGLPPSRSTLVA